MILKLLALFLLFGFIYLDNQNSLNKLKENNDTFGSGLYKGDISKNDISKNIISYKYQNIALLSNTTQNGGNAMPHCYHPYNSDQNMYEGKPLIHWWENGTCNKNNNIALNMFSNGRIQSVKDTNYYLCPDNSTVESGVTFKQNCDASFKYRNDNRMEYMGTSTNPSETNLCLGHINVHNSAWVHLQPCNKTVANESEKDINYAPPIIIIETENNTSINNTLRSDISGVIPLLYSNKGLVIDKHCAFQPKAGDNGYWGNPYNNWPLVYWWHKNDTKDGDQCFGNPNDPNTATNNDRRFRANFYTDGLIQSVYNNKLFLGTDSLLEDSAIKWFDISDNNFKDKIRKWEYRDSKLCIKETNMCLGHWSGDTVIHNNNGVHLRPMEKASIATIYENT